MGLMENRAFSGAMNRAGFRAQIDHDDAAKSELGFGLVLVNQTQQVNFTGSLVETVIATFTMPAGFLGPNGSLDAVLVWSCTNNANTKTIRVNVGGTTWLQQSGTTIATGRATGFLWNRNAENSQRFLQASGTNSVNEGTSGGVIVAGAVDTSADVLITVAATLTNVGDSIALEYLRINGYPTIT